MSIAVELMRQLEALTAEHNAERIEALTLATGEMRCVVPELLADAFAVVAEGSCAEGAAVSVEIVPLVAVCRGCGDRFTAEMADFVCRQCNRADVDIVEGNDILLTSVTFQEADTCARD
ncbi:MAG: hydrogenase maturation nickel metallochaperone HypA [Planctomycetota bacterium]|jgi:hydrogenase nickel incorporation protein HypA/HybF